MTPDQKPPPRTMSKEISREAIEKCIAIVRQARPQDSSLTILAEAQLAAIDHSHSTAAMRDELERVKGELTAYKKDDELTADNFKATRRQVQMLEKCLVQQQNANVDLVKQLAAQSARVQALEADKKRLDWLEGDTMRLQNVFGIQLNEDARRKDVRACIDAALSQEQATTRNV